MQRMRPETSFVHQCGDMVGLGQGLKALLFHELEDELVRRLLGPKTLLDAPQEIFCAFSGNLKTRRDHFEWFGFVHTNILPVGLIISELIILVVLLKGGDRWFDSVGRRRGWILSYSIFYVLIELQQICTSQGE